MYKAPHILSTAAVLATSARTLPRRQDPVGAFWCPGQESNLRHRDFQPHSLPTELPRHITRQVAALPPRRRFYETVLGGASVAVLAFGWRAEVVNLPSRAYSCILAETCPPYNKAHVVLISVRFLRDYSEINNQLLFAPFLFRSPFTRHFCVQAIIIRIKPLLFVSPVG